MQTVNKHYIKSTNNEYVKFFLVKIPDDFGGDISRPLVAVNAKIDSKQVLTNEDKIAFALQALFEIKTYEYGHYGLQNPLYLSTLNVESITKTNEIININLKGEIIGVGSMADIFIQMQITQTIEQYADKYSITLNSSEKEWRCALDYSGLCE